MLLVVAAALLYGHGALGIVDEATGTVLRSLLLTAVLLCWMTGAAYRRRKGAIGPSMASAR